MRKTEAYKNGFAVSILGGWLLFVGALSPWFYDAEEWAEIMRPSYRASW